MYIQVRVVKSDDTVEIVKLHASSLEEGKAIAAAENPGYKEISAAYAFYSIFLHGDFRSES